MNGSSRPFLHGTSHTHFPCRLDTNLSVVDFGYILGRDPKPFPPPVKVCKEMVDAMGGVQSSHYARFKNYCFTAFSILRKSANLILNLVALMVDANIPDIKHRDVHEQIQEKFRLDLTEEEAIKHFETLLNETSYFTVMFDRIHDLAQVGSLPPTRPHHADILPTSIGDLERPVIERFTRGSVIIIW